MKAPAKWDRAGLLRYARLFRWPNLLISLAALVLSWGLLNRWPTGLCSLAAWLAPLFVVAWANIRNDLRDLEVDRVAHPDRPLVRGELTTRQATWLAHFLGGLAVVLALCLPHPALWAVLGAMGALEAYNRWGKGIPGLGNVMVAVTGAVLFVYAALAVEVSPLRVLWPALYAFLFHWTRELLKDLADMEGDRVAGDRTLPLWIGEHASLRLWVALSLGFLAALPLAVIWGGYRSTFLIWAGVGFGFPYALLVGWIWRSPSPSRYRWAASRVKWLLIPAFWGLWIGRPPA